MSSKFYPGLILATVLCSGLSADITNTGHVNSSTGCGQDISPRDVMVLDLEPISNDLEITQDYLFEHAGEYRLLTARPEEMIMRSSPQKDPHGMFRQAQKLGERRGCDLVLILKTGPYFGKQRGWRMKRIKDKGYAFVVVGQRLAFE